MEKRSLTAFVAGLNEMYLATSLTSGIIFSAIVIGTSNLQILFQKIDSTAGKYVFFNTSKYIFNRTELKSSPKKFVRN